MNSFSGKAAKQAKNYFRDMHLTVLESFQGVFADLSENLAQHIETFESEVDSHESAVIESHYLLEVKEDINDIYEGLIEEDEEIHDTIEDISDISSAKVPDFSDVSEWKKKSVKHLTELDGDLASFTSTGNETDVEEILSQIEAVIDSAQTSEGKARFSDFKGASEISELEKLVEYNEDKQEEEMENAKEVKENTIEELNEDSSIDVINKAYQEYKDGDISYDQYIAILDSVKNTSDDMDEKTIKTCGDMSRVK